MLIETAQTSLWEHLERIADVGIFVCPAIYFFYKWTQRIDSMFGATKDITKVHLPFIYKRLHVHDVSLTLEPVEHPNIVLVANGSK